MLEVIINEARKLIVEETDLGMEKNKNCVWPKPSQNVVSGAATITSLGLEISEKIEPISS